MIETPVVERESSAAPVSAGGPPRLLCPARDVWRSAARRDARGAASPVPASTPCGRSYRSISRRRRLARRVGGGRRRPRRAVPDRSTTEPRGSRSATATSGGATFDVCFTRSGAVVVGTDDGVRDNGGRRASRGEPTGSTVSGCSGWSSPSPGCCSPARSARASPAASGRRDVAVVRRRAAVPDGVRPALLAESRGDLRSVRRRRRGRRAAASSGRSTAATRGRRPTTSRSRCTSSGVVGLLGNSAYSTTPMT